VSANKFRITFDYIIENKPVPPMVDPANFDGVVQDDYWFEWLTEESLAKLVKDVYDAYEHIQKYQLA
jgi:gamma-glutamyl phosphate reductase